MDSFDTSVTVSWEDASGEEQSNVTELTVPGCVADLLNSCDESTLPGSRVDTEGDEDEGGSYLVYYSTCNGTVLDEFWEADE